MILAVVPGCFSELGASWLALRQPFLAAGVIVILLGFLTYRPVLARFSGGLCVAISLLVPALGVGEFLFRTLGVDFRRTEAALQRLPPYYRRPTVPSGDVFFRRRGPEVWTGRVINTFLDQVRLETEAYADEPVVTVRYDADGFRNPPGLSDWEIAVAGDSFTELGFLPEDRLFTSLLAGRLGVRVRNLGVSHTGPLAQLHYLRAHGIAPSTRRVVIVFFEGNDLDDLDREYQAWLRFEETGVRPSGPLDPQTSLLRALGEAVVFGRLPLKPRVAAVPDARLRLGRQRIPVSLPSVPPLGRTEVTADLQNALAGFFDGYRELAASRDLVAWVVYLPCKLRVWHGLLEFPAGTAESIRNWTPTDLPDHLRELSLERGIRFLDVTSALGRATRDQGRLLFNPIVDTHLNAEGAAIVAATMAEAMRRPPVPAEGQAPGQEVP